MKVLLIALTIVAMSRARPDTSQVPSGSYLPTAGQTGDFGSLHINDISAGIGNSGDTNHIDGFSGYPQAQDKKHVYFYAAPDDQKFTRFKIVVTPQNHKNTKIIFIKAPSHGGVMPEVIAPPSVAEDKTLVYVLIKKPDEDGSITIPAGVEVKQNKPEVFFIKYKNPHDAEAQISGGVQGQRVGITVPDLDNEQSFVNTLDSGAGDHGSRDSHSNSGNYGPPGGSGPY